MGELVDNHEFDSKDAAIKAVRQFAVDNGFLTTLHTDNRTEGRPCLRFTCQRASKTYPRNKKKRKIEEGEAEVGGGDEECSEDEEEVNMLGIGGPFDPMYVDVGPKRGTRSMRLGCKWKVVVRFHEASKKWIIVYLHYSIPTGAAPANIN